jgi:hypothetical protein
MFDQVVLVEYVGSKRKVGHSGAAEVGSGENTNVPRVTYQRN